MAHRATGRGAALATALGTALLGTGAAVPAWAAPTFTQAGDATFRNITASGGALPGVDVSAATVSNGGTRTTLSSVAAQAAGALPATMGGQPNGWLKLDGNALVPTASLPSSVTNPVDQTARAAASAAQTAANAAEPASMAGQAGGFAALDGNALVPTANLPAAYTSSTAIPTSSLGQANGPARLDTADSLSSNTAAATASAIQRSLAAHFADVVDAADYGMRCDYQTLTDLTTTKGSVVVSSASYTFTQADVGRKFVGGYELGQTVTTIATVNPNGSANLASAATATEQATTSNGTTTPAHGYANLWTDDTNALEAAVTVASGRLGGADLVLPGGQCELSAEIDVTDSTSMRIRGSGDQATRLDWTTPTNGLIITETNMASLTVGDFMISKRQGTNNGTLFVGTALSVGGAAGATGENKVADVTIIGYTPAGQTDGWNQGLVETNIAHSFTSHVSVLQPGPTVSVTGAPSPTSLTSMPSALGFGIGADIVLHGSGSGGYFIDGSLDALTTTGGQVSLDMASVQGVYVTNSKFTYADYGVRADTANTTSELVTLSNDYVIANLADVYLNGVGDNQITGSMFWPNSNVASWQGLWLRNTDSDEVTGNGFLGHGGSSSVADYGVYVSWDNGGGYAHSLTGNTLYLINGTAIGNASGTGGIVAVGNSVIGSTVATSDPTYGATNGTGNGAAVATNGMGNLYFANLLNGLTAMSDDGNRNIQFAKNLTCGNLYDTCTFSVLNANKPAFQVTPNGNASAGSLTLTGNVSHTATEVMLGAWTGSNGGSLTLVPVSGALPAYTAGVVAMFGELACAWPSYVESWRLSGHYKVSTSGSTTTISETAFAATPEADADSTTAAAHNSGTAAVTPTASSSSFGLSMTFGSSAGASVDCSADVKFMLMN